jgi:hypothetical protein
MFLNQGTSQPEASQQKKQQFENGDMASWEEMVELDDVQQQLDDVQLATVVGGGKQYIASINKGQQAF